MVRVFISDFVSYNYTDFFQNAFFCSHLTDFLSRSRTLQDDNFKESFKELYCKASLCYIHFLYIISVLCLDCELPRTGIAG